MEQERKETNSRQRKSNSIETVSHVILTDRNSLNAKAIQATPQNSHIIKLIFLPFGLFLIMGWVSGKGHTFLQLSRKVEQLAVNLQPC